MNTLSNVQKIEALRALTYTRRCDPIGSNQFKQPEDFYPFDNRPDKLEWMVSPWTLAAHNVNSSLMIVGQDWASDTWLSACPEHVLLEGRDIRLPTNKRLDYFLLHSFGMRFDECYATNLFPFIKTGAMSTPIKSKHYMHTAEKYLIPQIKIVQPSLVICLGSAVFANLLRVAGQKVPRFSEAINMELKIHGSLIRAVYHPGGHGTRNAGGEQKAFSAWLAAQSAIQ